MKLSSSFHPLDFAPIAAFLCISSTFLRFFRLSCSAPWKSSWKFFISRNISVWDYGGREGGGGPSSVWKSISNHLKSSKPSWSSINSPSISSLIPPDNSRFPMTQALTELGFPKALSELGFILRHRFLVLASMVISSVTIPNDQLITSRDT